MEAARGDERRIEIAKRTRGGVARIGKQWLTVPFPLCVETLERLARKKDLTSDLQPTG